MIYLASPYSHKDPKIREQRFRSVSRAAGLLMMEGHSVFSPLSHSHPIAMELEDVSPTDPDFWLEHDMSFLAMCSMLIVLMLDGWDRSKGVKKEIEEAEKLGLPVGYLKGHL